MNTATTNEATHVERCTVCGMVANLDPSLHKDRYRHVPRVMRDGVEHVFSFTTYTFKPAESGGGDQYDDVGVPGWNRDGR